MYFLQVVRLRDVFPHGPGFVLVFDYMLSDLSKVIRNTECPLTEVNVLLLKLCVTSYIALLIHSGSNQELYDTVIERSSISTQSLNHAQGKHHTNIGSIIACWLIFKIIIIYSFVGS